MNPIRGCACGVTAKFKIGMIVGFTGLVSAVAQPSEGKEIGSDFLETEFRVYASHPRLAQEIFCVDSEGNPIAVDFRSNGRSQWVTYQGKRRFRFYSDGEQSGYVRRPVLGSPSQGQAALPGFPVAEVEIPEAIQQPLLLFLPNLPGEGLAWRVYPLEDSPDWFPYGTLRVLNLSGIKLRIEWGEWQQKLEGGATLPIRQRHTDSPRLLRIFQERSPNSDLIVIKKPLMVRDHERLLIVVCPPQTPYAAELPVQILREYR